jgi:hypothetical protein
MNLKGQPRHHIIMRSSCCHGAQCPLFFPIVALLLLLAAAQSTEVPLAPIAVRWVLNVSAAPNAKLDNERIQVALYSNDPSSLNLGFSVATQPPLHAVSSRGWSLMSDKSTWGFAFYEDSKMVERLRRTADGPIIVGLGGNVGCHVCPSELECYAVVDGNWCVVQSHSDFLFL